MDEKPGALTNVVFILVTLVVIVGFIKFSFPEVTTDITEKMRNIVDISPENYEGHFK